MFPKRLLVLLASLALLTQAAPAAPGGPTVQLARPARYDGQMLVRFTPSKAVVSAAAKLHLDVWSKSRTGFDVRVTQAQLAAMRRALGQKRAGKIVNANIQKAIDVETKQLNAQLARGVKVEVSAAWHTEYHRFADINTWIQQLAKQYSSVVTYVPSIGKTVEKRDIPMLKITSNKGDLASKKRIWLQGMQHAREWISGATMQFLADQLASKYGSDARVTNILDQVEVVIVPVCNPDGYEYTWGDDRLWRKTRAIVRGSAQGVDPNRNWPDHWNKGGSSRNPSDETYMGPAPASEPEVKALMAAYKATPNVIAAVDFHSFSQLVLRPYGWTTKNNPDNAAFTALGKGIVDTISGVAGTEYVNERIVDLYVASGGANDWWYGVGTDKGTQKPYGIAIELSPDADSWEDGFILPPDHIVPVGTEIFPATLNMIEYALAHPLGAQS